MSFDIMRTASERILIAAHRGAFGLPFLQSPPPYGILSAKDSEQHPPLHPVKFTVSSRKGVGSFKFFRADQRDDCSGGV